MNILAIDPTDQDEIGELIDLLRANCTPDACGQFLTGIRLRRWERYIASLPRPAREEAA